MWIKPLEPSDPEPHQGWRSSEPDLGEIHKVIRLCNGFVCPKGAIKNGSLARTLDGLDFVLVLKEPNDLRCILELNNQCLGQVQEGGYISTFIGTP